MTWDEVVAHVPVGGVSLGTMYFGSLVPGGEAHRILDAAHEAGVRFWDTANNYAFWVPGGTGDESEECLGGWLAARGPRVRDEVVLATKLGARPRPGGRDLSAALGLSASAIREQLTGSLRRLGVDHVDVLYAHVDDPAVPLAEVVGTLNELREQGLTRAVAASNLTAGRLRAATATGGGYAALQQRFTYLVPDPDADLYPHVLLDAEVERVCAEAGVAMLGYSPLLGGVYTRSDRPLPSAYRTAGAGRALRALHEVAGHVGLDAGQTVLAWMVQRARPVLPVVGVSNVEQLRSAVRAVTTALPADLVTALDTARVAG
jgi:aryl-alcohol dehydrogenase-like predicted oxidoreductase